MSRIRFVWLTIISLLLPGAPSLIGHGWLGAFPSSPSASSARSPVPDSLYDVFPLRPGLSYSYHLSCSSRSGDEMSVSGARDSGEVRYQVCDSISVGDSVLTWTVREIRKIVARRTSSPPVGRGTDTTYAVSDTVSLVLTEKLQGRHELLCNGYVWSFPLYHLRHEMHEPMYRFADSTPVTREWSWNNPLGHYVYGSGTDVVLLSTTSGYSSRRFQESWSSGYLLGNASEEIQALSDPVLSVRASSSTPQEPALLQNYPNPFNPSTTIEYTIGGVGLQASGVSRVKLAVYDMLGREVAVLVDEPKAPGRYSARLHAAELPSGVYFYRLQADSKAQTKTLVLLR